MALTIISRKGKGKVKMADGSKKEVTFNYDKIITPATKRGGKDEVSTFPTFADLAEKLKGKVEFELDKEGNPVGSCLVGYAIEGWNLESNRNAAFNAANTPEVAVAKINEQIAAMAAKFGMTVDDFKAQLLG